MDIIEPSLVGLHIGRNQLRGVQSTSYGLAPLELSGLVSNKSDYSVASVTQEAVPAVGVGLRSECDLSTVGAVRRSCSRIILEPSYCCSIVPHA